MNLLIDYNKSISIVIPTHNRYDKLRLLKSIEKLSYHLVSEVIVVDDSTDKVELADIGNIKINHICLNRRIFISKAKNIGWKTAKSEYVYFIDDDNVLTDHSIKPLIVIMETHPEIGALMPAVLYKNNPELVWVYSTPLSPKRWSFALLGRNRPRDPTMENKLLETDALPNASLVRSEVLQKTGGFNETLVVNSSAEFCRRVKLLGWRVYSCTLAFILHDVELPGRIGWWAVHGVKDLERVRYEVSDWFKLMKILHPDDKYFKIKAVARSSGFIIPNAAAYMMKGGAKRSLLLSSQLIGLFNGLRS